MPLLEELGVDVNAVNVSEMEDQMKAGGLLPVGLHHAILEGYREGSANNGRKFRELKFKVLAGPGKGFEVKESLWNSDEAKGKNRVLCFAHRLGVLQRVGEKLVPIPGINDFGDRIGTQIIIDVKHKAREYEKDGEKRQTTDVILSFEGVLSLDDPRAAKVVRAGGQAVAAAVASAPKQQDYGDL